MTIPAYENMQFVDKNGWLTSQWEQLLIQLILALQYGLDNPGYVIPSLDAVTIATLTTSPNGTMIYDSTNDLLKVNIAGTFKTVTTS